MIKLNLRSKIFLLILFALLGVFISSSFIYYKNIQNYAVHNAYKLTKYDLRIIDRKIFDINRKTDLFIDYFTKNEKIVSSLNLISNYQDKKDYDKNIFDVEKKKLLNDLLNAIGETSPWSASFFDKEGDILVFKRYKNKESFKGYSSIENNQIRIYDQNDNLFTEFKPVSLDISNLDTFEIKDSYNGNEIVLRKTVLIKNENNPVGYLRIKYILDKSTFDELVKISETGIFITGRTASLNNGSFYIDFNTIYDMKKDTLIDFKNHFLTVSTLKSNDIFVVSYINKELFNKYLKNTIFDLSVILTIIGVVFLFISSFFTKRFIINPLEKLLRGISQLKHKQNFKIDIKSGDEIEMIANEFNNISVELENSFRSIEDSKILLENVLNTVPMSIFIKDTQGKYILANKLFLSDAKLTDFRQLYKKDDFAIWEKEDALYYRSVDQEVLKTMKPVLNFEEKQIRNGKEHILHASKMPLVNSNNETIGILGVYKDITDEKKKETKLKEKEKYLLHQSRLAQMGEMLSMIAHQWRQPLAAISSTSNTLYLKTVMKSFDSEFFAQRLQNISDYSQHLSSTIDDFRNFFKKNKEKKEIFLNTVIEDSLKIMQTSIENKNIKIIKDYKDTEKITTYPNELRQVVLNLIKNAEDILNEKDQKEKWIKLETYQRNGKYILKVSDNAGGVPIDIIDKIFEPYFSTKTNKNGTGLGLYMSKSIIEEHCGGKIDVKNNNFGAVFRIVL